MGANARLFRILWQQKATRTCAINPGQTWDSAPGTTSMAKAELVQKSSTQHLVEPAVADLGPRFAELDRAELTPEVPTNTIDGPCAHLCINVCWGRRARGLAHKALAARAIGTRDLKAPSEFPRTFLEFWNIASLFASYVCFPRRGEE